MDYQLGAEVRRSDAGKVGEVQRIVVDPETQQVVSLVVMENRVDGHEVVVPIGLVNAADSGAVELAIDQARFEQLEAFRRTVNVAPPPDAVNVTSDEIKDPVDVPDVLPVGAATGIESIAYTPVLDEALNVQPGDVVLDGETTVYATDGEAGRVFSVRVNDETERVESLLATHGLFPERQIVVPWQAVRSAETGSIVLSVPRSGLTSLDDE